MLARIIRYPLAIAFTAGLVSAIWLLAGPALTSMFQEALAKVTGK